ncbi:hypothetical protein LTR37_001902 [Vermiconidia calcicola]|uniref:Uncharacterized protein n=1 Tax=Vermiconidia calcicola TaxID=1690605 RepID=A0ACC3NUD7_9PEZI|nr:hypothetical protein LTR37_001902 [Vermiconidia calcicola]
MGPLSRPLRFIRRQLPEINFITIHYLYFIFTSLTFALIFWGSSHPSRSVSFTDSLFLTVSAMTNAGMNTVNLSDLNTFQQFLLFVLQILGSSILAFVKKFDDVKRRGRIGRVKTWAGDTLKGRSRTSLGDGNQDEKSEQADAAKEDEKQNLDMDNGVSNKVGERVDTTMTGSGSREDSPDRSHIPGVWFRDDVNVAPDRPATATTSRSTKRAKPKHSGLFTINGIGARPLTSLATKKGTPVALQNSTDIKPSIKRAQTTLQAKGSRGDISKYFDSVEGWISRNSQFHGLTEDEREKLGGIEYRAVALLAWLVPFYFVIWQLIGCIGCGAWVALNAPGTALTNGVNPWWAGAFNAASGFSNSGMSLLDANMIAFQRSYYMMLTVGLLLLAGNTCYPIFLRIIIWSMLKIAESFAINRPEDDPWNMRVGTLRFLLDHPRRCYTHLFPSQHTWWLAASVIALNAIDWILFELLNIGNRDLIDSLPVKYRVLAGLFQSISVRGGGFFVVGMATLRISLQVLYVVMMYISVYPVVITMRNSNVYEERSLGVYADEDADVDSEDEDESEMKKLQTEYEKQQSGRLLKRAKTIKNHFGQSSQQQETNSHFVRQQLRAQLAHDTWWIVLATFLIMIIEADNFARNPEVFSVFNFLFEIVSAYGSVGLSLGVPWDAYSFCGSWSVLGKLLMILVMLRGRHRGLPVAIDKAVLLPGESQGQAEEEDGRIRVARTLTRSLGDA